MSAGDDTGVDAGVDIDRLLEHGPWLERLARKLVSDASAADDLVQETWIKVLRSSARDVVHTRGWLRAVLSREVYLRFRGEQRRRRHEGLAGPGHGAEADPALGPQHEELCNEIAALAHELPEPFRSTLRLRFFEDLSSADIARRLDIPPATVRSRLMHGLDRLRAELRRRHPDRALATLLLPLTRNRPTAAPRPGSPPAHTTTPRRLLLSQSRFALFALFLALCVSAPWWMASKESRAGSPLAAGSAIETAATDAASLRDARSNERTEFLGPTSGGETAPASSEESAPAPLRFEVQVLDPAADARAGATVLVFRRSSASFEECERTDDGGRARVEFDPADLGAWGGKGSAGRIALRASAPGWAHSDVLLASPGSARAPVRLVLPGPGTTFEGTLVDPQGEPLADGVVEAGYAQGSQLSGPATDDLRLPQPVRARTDEHGRFRIEGVDGSSGRVRVLAARTGWVPSFFEQVVDGSSERDCRITLTPGGSVRGTVLDAHGRPLGGARVWSEPAENGGDGARRSSGYDPRMRGWSIATRADSGGSFELVGVPPGKRVLWASDPERAEQLGRAVLDVPSSGSVEWLPVLAYEPPLEVALEASDRELAGWIVRLWFPGPDGRRCIREAETDAAGRARFLDVCHGAIEVSVFAADTGLLCARMRTSGIPEGPLRIALDEPAHLFGSILHADGAPFAGGLLRIVARGGLAPWMELAHDPQSGVFERELPPGAYDLIASVNGSNATVASFELVADEQRDLGPIRAPPLAKLRIEVGDAGPGRWPEYRILQVDPRLPPSLNTIVEVGAWPPPPERELLRGNYVLEAGVLLATPAAIERRFDVDLAETSEVVLRVHP